jgi:PAS domain S-box-containing protein
MTNLTQLARKDEPFRASQIPVSNEQALQCTVRIDDNGTIQDSFGQIEEMFGYWFEELKGRHISMLLPDLANAELVVNNRVNSAILFRCHCSIPFRGVNKHGHEHKYLVYMNLLSAPQSGRRFTLSIRDFVP